MSNLINFATNAAEKGAYDVEQMKQATGAAQGKTSSNASTYVDGVKGTASDVVASVQETASQAASQTKKATDNFQLQAALQTNVAANEGQKHVEAIKATGAGYVDQAKSLVGNALSTTQGHVFGLSGNSSASNPNAPQSTSLQSTANTTIETSKTYVASAQEAIQPYLQSAQETVQPYLESAQATIQPHMQTTINATKPKVQSTLASIFGSGRSK